MNSIKFILQNCYGIKDLDLSLDYSNGKNAHVIYAPNGVMKTSLANVLRFISKQSKEVPSDRLHKDIDASFIVKADGVDMDDSNLFVADAEEVKIYDANESISTLLASKKLKDEYDSICKQLDKEKNALIKQLKSESDSRDCDEEIMDAFASHGMSLYDCLESITEIVGENQFHQFKFRYNDVFDKKGAVKAFLDEHRDALTAYVSSYNRLLSSSAIFRSEGKWQFGTYQADRLLTTTSDGAFFGVHHKMVLQDATSITSVDDFKEKIKTEKERIFSDPTLIESFNAVASKLDSNPELRKFQLVITAQKEILAELSDYEKFRKKVWLGHFASPKFKPLLESFCALYKEKKPKLQEIISEAQKEQEIWRKIVDMFGNRFHMPFRVDIANRADVVLNQQTAHVVFYYKDNAGNEVQKTRDELVAILSKGEQRALYILQLLFELEARKREGRECLLVFDDIADSFDYRNKYAIVEYLYDLNNRSQDKFKLLILTHNFDFYRTLFGRLNLQSVQIHMAMKQENGLIHIKNGNYVKDVYSKIIIPNSNKPEFFLTWIPFARNIIAYHEGEECENYKTLTCCLHQKADTASIVDSDVVKILNSYSQTQGCKWKCSGKKIENIIFETADNILAQNNIDPICIENKVVLSMAIRHLAEKYMRLQMLNAGVNPTTLETNNSQTGRWTQLLKVHCPSDNKLDVIEKVNMMTPELIHINSFMYEPLIDMSIEHLLSLYKECKQF